MWRAVAWLGLAAAVVSGFCHAVAAQPARPVRVLEVRGVINPFVAQHVERSLGQPGARLYVVLLDTPGGSEGSMRRVVQAILASEVLVAVYVAPAGARAGSAGMFVALAGHIMAMSPGRHIFLIYWKVVNPTLSVLKVRDFAGASTGIATTTLRAVIGDILLDDVLAKREVINQVLRVKLDEVTERWGVKVTSVEIREIEPPREVQAAMNRQMAAERERRATVTEADGKREASVKVAEGEKQAAILRAEGAKQAAILQAEGNRQAAILNAEGYSMALERISAVARSVDAKTMSLQYLDALKVLGESSATKFVLPLELTRLMGPFVQHNDEATRE